MTVEKVVQVSAIGKTTVKKVYIICKNFHLHRKAIWNIIVLIVDYEEGETIYCEID